MAESDDEAPPELIDVNEVAAFGSSDKKVPITIITGR